MVRSNNYLSEKPPTLDAKGSLCTGEQGWGRSGICLVLHGDLPSLDAKGSLCTGKQGWGGRRQVEQWSKQGEGPRWSKAHGSSDHVMSATLLRSCDDVME